MSTATHTDTLAPIRQKLRAGERLDAADGVTLLDCDDVLAVGELADSARRLRGVSDDVWFARVADPDDPGLATVVYGRGETNADRIAELIRLRDAGGIIACLPLPFDTDATTGHDDLKMIAVSRLMLDNVPNIRAHWTVISTPLAQVALHFGANDIEGAVADDELTIIREAGRTPVERGTPRSVA